MQESFCYSIQIKLELKRDSDTFDVAMQANDGAEIWELVEYSSYHY